MTVSTIPSTYPAAELFIGGEWLSGDGRKTTPLIDPATGRWIGALPHVRTEDLDVALEAATAGFERWRRVSAYERGRVLRRAADLLRARTNDLAPVMTLEQGKPVSEAALEFGLAADVFDWFAQEATRVYGRIVPSRSAELDYRVRREPVGPVAAFSPWNIPAAIPARKIAAALAAGCSVIAKPAEETPATCLALARALDDAGLPKGVLQVVTGDPDMISRTLLASHVIRKISFTGSTAVGKHLAGLAAKRCIRTTLELGGHAPVLVLDDANVELAARLSAAAKFRNAGQVCIAPTRFYVHDAVYDHFVDQFTAHATSLVVGNGLRQETQMGPLASKRRQAAVGAIIEDAIGHGAECVRGQRPDSDGFFCAPTVLLNVSDSAAAMQEEPFGPVALIQRITSLDEGIDRANRLPFGLAAYAYTKSIRNVQLLSDRLECGMLGINNHVLNLPETPFGGVKESGHGSEGGSEGIDPYLVTKFVSLASS